MPAPKTKPYTVVRDSREQLGWTFPADKLCRGWEVDTLPTGDYTLRGYETKFVVERKGSTGEVAQNINQERFARELVRLDEFEFPFLVCEFTLEDVVNFPHNSGIPEDKWDDLKVSAKFLMMRLNEFQLRHRTRLIFAGSRGREFCSSLFKRVTEHVEPTAK